MAGGKGGASAGGAAGGAAGTPDVNGGNGGAGTSTGNSGSGGGGSSYVTAYAYPDYGMPGAGGAGSGGSGGAAGTFSMVDGTSAASLSNAGGGGGRVGNSRGRIFTGNYFNLGDSSTGNTGGNGGNGDGGGGGGGGGQGGVGYYVSDYVRNFALTTTGTFTGGDGGRGGAAGGASGSGAGNGGDGGFGLILLQIATFTNAGMLQGGNGGLGGLGGASGTAGSAGLGGAGLVTANTAVINNGSIFGGFKGGSTSESDRADAIDFIDGTNSLTPGTGTLVGGIGIATRLSILGANVTLGNQIHDYSIGAGSLAKSDGGTLILTGANTYSGGTAISNNSTIQLGVSQALGTGGLTFSGANAGTLTLDGNAQTLTTLTGTSGIVQDASSTNAGLTVGSGSFGGTIQDGTGGGTLSLIKQGAGLLTLSGSNTYTGGTTFAGGILNVGSTGALGTVGALSFMGGTLQYSAANQTDYSGRFSQAANQAYSIDTNHQSITFGSALTSSGGTLVKLGEGALTLTGASTYAGTTTISAGTLQLGDGTTNGSLATASAITIATDATLAFTEAGTVTIGNTIMGGGSLTQTGPGAITLSAANSYTGVTTIDGGTLRLSSAGSISSSSNVTVNGFFDTYQASAPVEITSLDGTSAGTLSIGLTGLTLTTANGNYAGRFGGNGTLTIAAGTETLTGSNGGIFSGAINLAANTTLTLGVTDAGGSGLLTFGTGAQTLNLDAVGEYFNTLTGFAIEDTIDLRGLASSGATASYNAGTHTLTVTSGANTDTMHFDRGYMLPAGYQFTVSDDGAGYAKVTLGLIPSSSGGGAPATFSQPSEFGMTVTSSASPAGAVYGLYKALLGHTPDPLGLEAFAGSIQNGATPADVAAAILTSPEYTARNPNPLTDSAYVSSLYTSLLNRAPDAQGQAYFQGELSAGVSRATVASQIATSQEAQNVLQPTFANGVFVTNATDAQIARLYYGILGRTPDATGLASFEAQAKGLGIAGVAQTMLSSSEFGAKFGNLSDAGYIDTLYVDALGHHADAAALSYWGSQLPAQGRVQVAVQIAQSQEAQVHLVGVIEQGMQVTA